MSEATQYQRQVLGILAKHYQTHAAFPGYDDLGAYIGKSRETARKLLQELVVAGFLKGDGRSKPDGFTEAGAEIGRAELEAAVARAKAKAVEPEKAPVVAQEKPKPEPAQPPAEKPKAAPKPKQAAPAKSPAALSSPPGTMPIFSGTVGPLEQKYGKGVENPPTVNAKGELVGPGTVMNPMTQADPMTAPTVARVAKDTSLLAKVAQRWEIEPTRLRDIIVNQVISVGYNQPPPTIEEVVLVCHVMNKYGLDPLIREAYAFRGKGGKINVGLGYDGWIKQAMLPDNQYDGHETIEGPLVERTIRGRQVKVFEYVKTVVYRKDRKVPISYTAFFDEWFNPSSGNTPSDWEVRPNHRLTFKSMTEAFRIAFGISLADITDKEIIEAGVQAELNGGQVEEKTQQKRSRVKQDLAARLAAAKEQAAEPEPTPDPGPGTVEAEFEDIPQDAPGSSVSDEVPQTDGEPHHRGVVGPAPKETPAQGGNELFEGSGQ